MKVLIVRSFIDQIEGKKYNMTEGQVVDLPDGANWLDVGFAIPQRSQAVETATIEAKEKAVTRKRATTRKTKKTQPKESDK